VRVEIRTVNNRHFKLSLRLSEGFGSLEPRIDKVVRERIRRGTVQMMMRIDVQASGALAINQDQLTAYYQQIEKVHQRLALETPVQLEGLLALPGVVNEGSDRGDEVEEVWPVAHAALLQAIDTLEEMRKSEGAAMDQDLRANCSFIGDELSLIEARAPLVVENHRDRLMERVNRLLQDHGVKLETNDVIREMGILADRIDIAEETVRLRSHLEQFSVTCSSDESLGRKLEFLIQEMFRETNTIGSKANDAEIAQHVVQIKSAIERLREMIQNIE